jgi:hypothetical protein
MALTFTESTRFVVGDRVAVSGKVTFDSSYPTGGEAVTASLFGLPGGSISHIVLGVPDVVTKNVRWDRANSKLLVVVEDGTSGIEAEAANASDQSAVDVEVLVFGK